MFYKVYRKLLAHSTYQYRSLNMCLLLPKKTSLSKSVFDTSKNVRFANGIRVEHAHKGKTFQESENEFAHHIMENLALYQETVVKQPLQTAVHPDINSIIGKSESSHYDRNSAAVDSFLRLSKSCQSNNLDLENTLYCDLISRITRELSTISDETLINILASLCVWPLTHSTETPNFKMLWNALDNECVNRIEKWSINRQLLVADYWFHLKLNRIGQYNMAMINILVKKVNILLPSQIVQLLFYINLQRHVKPRSMHHIEARLNAVLPNLSINEVGIVCLGFFKTKTKFRDSLVLTNIINFTSKHISAIDRVSLSAILKQLRNCSVCEHSNDFSALLTKCAPLVEKWPPVIGIHLILLGSYIDLYHPVIIDSVTERILPNAREIRLKDLAKLLFYIAKHRHVPQQGNKVFEILVNELRSIHRQDELNYYPHFFVSSLLYLAYCNIYPEDLISKALDPSFIKAVQGW